LDIKIPDHIIITNNGFYSLADNSHFWTRWRKVKGER
jgi:hypothetical protein